MVDLLSSPSFQQFVETGGLWILFAVVMLESLGMPIPGDTALMTAAIYAGATQTLDIALVVGVAAAGAIVGDNIGYLIGRSIGYRLLVRYGHYIRLNQSRLKIGQYLFLRHGGKIVFFGRFVTFVRTLAALLAGTNHMAWPRFFLMNALGGACWAILVGGGAYLFGESIRLVAGPVGIALIIGAVGLIISGLLFFHRHERELEARARQAIP